MSELTHIIKKNNEYFAVDGDMLAVHKLTGVIAEKISTIDAKSREMIAKRLIIKNHNNVCPQLINHVDYRRCSRLVLNLTSNCNLRCKYCYANAGLYASDQIPTNMTLKTLENALDVSLKIFPDGIKTVQFFGGEPLMNKPILLMAIQKIRAICKNKEIAPPQFTIVTNGTLIDDDCLELFNNYFSSVTISIDGCKDVNDSYRVFANSSFSVYETIVSCISKMSKSKRNYLLSLEGSLTNVHMNDFLNNGDLSSIDDLFRLGADFYQFAPAFDTNNSGFSMTEYPKENICDFFDILTKRLLTECNYYRIGTKSKIKNLFVDKEYGTKVCGAGITELTIDVNGLLYPCFMFAGIEKFVLGKVDNFDMEEFNASRGRIREFFQRAELCSKCTNCWAKKMCGQSYSRCLGARYLITGDVIDPIDLGCELSKTVIERLIKETLQ